MSESLAEIPAAHVTYALEQGEIPAWLIAGPVAADQPDWAQHPDGDVRERIVAAVSTPTHETLQTPVEWGKVGAAFGELRWKILPVGRDHLLDLAVTTEGCQHLTVWAYAQLVATAAQPVVFTLTTYSPVEVWIDGAMVASSHRFYDGTPGHLVFNAVLRAGANELLLRLQTVALGATPLAVGARVHSADGKAENADEHAEDTSISVHLPTLVTPIERRQKLAALMEEAYLTRDVFVRKGKINLWWPKSITQVDKLTARLQLPQDRIVAEAAPLVERGARVAYGEAADYRPGEYEIRLLPELNEYYVDNVRVERRLRLAVANAAHSSGYYGDLDSRREELWREVATGRDLWAELAKLALGEATQVSDAAVDAALDDVAQARGNRYDSLMALIRLAVRHADTTSKQKSNAVQAGLRSAYGEAPTLVPVHPQAAEAILTATAHLLIAEHLPNFRMDARGRSAALLQALQRYAEGEWTQVNDGEAMAQLFVALAHLVDLASDRELVELAAVCLDKLCFELALNSYQGIPGGGQTATVTRRLQSGRLHPLSGVCRLLWGAGAFCPPYAAAMSVACATEYVMPDVIVAAALDQTTDAWSQLRYRSVDEPIQQAIYRTPDYLLGTLVDYRAGTPGSRETVVQAVLAPEALVSINHPGADSSHDAYAPNYWRGNGRLPRAAQWCDAAVVLFDLPEDGSEPFTHAYWPLAAFDQVAQAGDWLCGRKGGGYLALTAAQGLARLETGPTAMREVRSQGRRNVWVVQMGRAAVHGSFDDFAAAVAQRRPAYDLDGDAPAVTYTNLQGETLAMGWDQGLMVNGAAVNTAVDIHVASPYGSASLPASYLDLKFQDYLVRLAFDADVPNAEQPDTV